MTILESFDKLKEKHPEYILAMEMGTWVHFYRQDAIDACKIVSGLALVTCGSPPNQVEITGCDRMVLEPVLRKLLAAGRKVAICEFLGDAHLVKD